MVAVPEAIPVIIPVAVVTCTELVFVLLHVPPAVLILSDVLVPWHITVVPAIVPIVLTVKLVLVVQPCADV